MTDLFLGSNCGCQFTGLATEIFELLLLIHLWQPLHLDPLVVHDPYPVK